MLGQSGDMRSFILAAAAFALASPAFAQADPQSEALSTRFAPSCTLALPAPLARRFKKDH